MNAETTRPRGSASSGQRPTPRDARSIYSFESKGRRQFAGPDEENVALREFGARLRIPNSVVDNLAADDRRLLLNFILNHHKVISRYQELRARETRSRVFFTVVSLVLLGGLPVLIFLAGSRAQGTAQLITSQLTALITGLVAVQKSLSSWLDKRKVLGNFRKAEADVKSNLYAFEDKWAGKAFDDEQTEGTVAVSGGTEQTPEDARVYRLDADFLTEARAAIAEARRIVEDEESQYFQAVTYPSIDLFDVLRDTGERAKGLVTAHLPFDLDQKAKEREVKALLEGRIDQQDETIARLEAELKARMELVERRRTEMAAASAEDAGALKGEIDDQVAKVRRLEDELLVAKSQAAALQHARSAALRR